ncbi:peptide/nickel transport system ATP-binding protein [Aequitasia blattaphilus]|uniref:ABC transporter ATP-binding protein n=1 Tax=Aequitasia blattaphilus TaxID=2949332 RepID=A0ABT1E976_9FIRM|nr:ABC transporter ATP-binding protein [Aequitasia blattaphilus]MCP1102159.1 ABC transporter ATP-binding protein [Aequitasia blattaphilus]MCR8614799.1 ABC transporter ATP-binding protein [Aequitasia blattaphilus]
MKVLEVRGLNVWFCDRKEEEKILKDISFSVEEGEVVGVVGQSGAGKSSLMKCLLNLLPQGTKVSHERWQVLHRSEMGIIFQNPSNYLNPVLKIGYQIEESIRIHRKITKKEARTETEKLLDLVGIREPQICRKQYPFQLSGGMQQRVAIAMAIAAKPKLLIADEPTTALDPRIQSQVLSLLKRISQELGMAILLVTHDLGVAAALCSRLIVMEKGTILEQGSPRELIKSTKKLKHSLHKEKDQFVQIDHISYCYKKRWGEGGTTPLHAVRDVSLEICKGETLGIVGESGSGKTTLSRMVAGIINPTKGSIQYRDSSKGSTQMVFQHPQSSMNPYLTVEKIIAEPLQIQRIDKEEIRKRVREMLELVSLSEEDMEKYPNQFSGGQQQRIAIARALISNPKLIICDEAVSSLDVPTQRQIIQLLKEIQEKRQVAYLFISHNIPLVSQISHKMAVMYRGCIVEMGDGERILEEPWHPYTKDLLDATIPEDFKRARKWKRILIKPEPKEEHKGCPYVYQCSYAMKKCYEGIPPHFKNKEREVACFLYEPKQGEISGGERRITSQI